MSVIWVLAPRPDMKAVMPVAPPWLLMAATTWARRSPLLLAGSIRPNGTVTLPTVMDSAPAAIGWW